MIKKLLFLLFLSSTFSFSQVTVYEDSFETYPDFVISGITDGTNTWDVLDLDLLNTYTGGAASPTWANAGAPMAYQIFNPTTALVASGTGDCNTTENIEFAPHTGSKYAAAWAGVPSSNGQTATANNDWLISPPINLAGATGSSLSVWVKSLSDCYGYEMYRLGVYVGTGTPTSGSDFTPLTLGVQTANSWSTWIQKTQSLSAYDGQTIRIGIKCETSDAYMFMVDDFKITAATLSNESFLARSINVSPNPATDYLNINSDSVIINRITITDLNGRIVKTVELNQTHSQINISDLNSGVYFMELQSEEGNISKKIVKK